MTQATLPYDLAALQQQVNAGQQFAYLHFWGHTNHHPQQVNASCFSQWYPSSFLLDGQKFLTAEQAMMAGKAALFGDHATRQRILQASHPKEAKSLGRLVAGFDETRWLAARNQIVLQANLAKFRQNPAMAQYLLQTGERILVEASPVDRIWGIGLAADHPHANQPHLWRGENLLGFVLMQVRAQLALEAA